MENKQRKNLRQWLLLSIETHIQIHGPGARSIFVAQDVYDHLRKNQVLAFENGKAYIKGNGRVIEVGTNSSIDFLITVI